MTKFLNISTDNTLGGNSPSDELAVSQKAIKTYVDNHSGATYSAGTGISIDANYEISVTSAISTGATGNVKLNGVGSQQTISLTSGSGTTALGVKSMATSSYISFSGSDGWLASFGIASNKKPVIYDGASHSIAYITDIPTVVSSVSSSSTNDDAVGAKLFYDTCGDIESLINAL